MGNHFASKVIGSLWKPQLSVANLAVKNGLWVHLGAHHLVVIGPLGNSWLSQFLSPIESWPWTSSQLLDWRLCSKCCSGSVPPLQGWDNSLRWPLPEVPSTPGAWLVQILRNMAVTHFCVWQDRSMDGVPHCPTAQHMRSKPGQITVIHQLEPNTIQIPMENLFGWVQDLKFLSTHNACLPAFAPSNLTTALQNYWPLGNVETCSNVAMNNYQLF